MKDAEFEETEYRGPLYNQLEVDNHLLWEPGQVFEKYIGIDRAAYCTNLYFWRLKGYNQFLNGVELFRHDWKFIWNERKARKKLPNFKLNLFIQAKRSQYSSRSKKALANAGLNGKYWKFDITPHQQTALEKVAIKLRNKALIVYAAPAFHKQSDLYKHTSGNTIVENSTFPDISELVGHTKWYYNRPGANGVANPDYKFLEGSDLISKINKLVDSSSFENDIKDEDSLNFLAKDINSVLGDSELSNYFESARYFDELKEIERIIQNASLEEDANKVRDYLSIVAFTNVFKLNWHILGNNV